MLRANTAIMFCQAESWNDLVKFLQELCGLARHLQPNARADLLGQLVNLGLFEVHARGTLRLSSLQGSDMLLDMLLSGLMPHHSEKLAFQAAALLPHANNCADVCTSTSAFSR